MTKVVVQKQAIDCDLQIEKGYYENKERALKLKSCCIHCCQFGTKIFVLGLRELRECYLKDGYNCYPISVEDIRNGNKPIRGGKKNEIQVRKKWIAKSKK